MGFHKAPDVERVYLKFLKQVLKVRQQTPNSAVYGELGKVPLDIVRKERILKYYFKVIKAHDNLLNEIFVDQVNCNIAGSCAFNVSSLFNELGFSYLWNDSQTTKLQLSKVIERLHDQYYQSFYGSLNMSSKLKFYFSIKTCIGEEKYLNCIHCDKFRIALSRLRCSAHKLAIEEGRYRNIKRQERKCIFYSMNVVEDEYHFILFVLVFVISELIVFLVITVIGQLYKNLSLY